MQGVGRGRCDVAHEVVHAESGIHVARRRDGLRELLRLVDSCRFVIPVHTWRGRTRCACTHQGRVRCGAIAKNLPPTVVQVEFARCVVRTVCDCFE